MQYFLAKTDPDTYSVDSLEKDKETIWDGVHNFEAINAIKNMKVGDLIYLYHSQTDKSIVGLMKVIDEPFENTDDPRKSWAVKVAFVKRYKNGPNLAAFKADPTLRNFKLVTHSRLSVMEVPSHVVSWIESRVE